MTKIVFSYPLLLLLLIPAIGLAFIPYFKIAKKFRRNRNRITSLVLHCVGILCVTLALSGMRIVNSKPNTANELMILVDVSATQEQSADAREGYILDLLDACEKNNFTVGVITFGYDQVYAVPLTTDVGSVYKTYTSAELPDISATDYEGAFNFALDKFNHPETSKIILITDGKETDGNVTSSLIGKYVSQGIQIDTVYVSSEYTNPEVQLVSVETPDYYVKAGTECSLRLNVLAKADGYVKIYMKDNDVLVSFGEEGATVGYYETAVENGVHPVYLPHVFDKEGLHSLKFEIEVVKNDNFDDTIKENNVYNSYVYIQSFKKLMVIEKYENESTELVKLLQDKETLGDDGIYDVSVYNLTTDTVAHYPVAGEKEEGKVPETIDDFRAYYQIILNNVSNSDLTDREKPIDDLIYNYVYQYGGGVLTVGGNDPVTGNEHMYNRSDLYGSKYQQMLPVEAVKYTPPLGVYIIVDTSGSMTMDSATISGELPLHWAKVAAAACLNALTERDYIGIMTLGSKYSDILPLTPRTREEEIKSAIESIKEANSGTIFTDSLMHAAEQLRAAQVEKRHIILVSDGEIGDEEEASCAAMAKLFYEQDNLTVSAVVIGSAEKANMVDIVTATRKEGWDVTQEGGGYYQFDSNNITDVAEKMIKDLSVPEIKSINYEKFNPTVSNRISQVVQGLEMQGNRLTVTLGGYYGTKIKQEVKDGDGLILTGSSLVPIYARWKFGNGNVGSFMCDLKNSEWSKDLFDSAMGKQLVYNIIDNLMPISDITPKEISVDITSKNYGNHLTRYGALNSGETIKGTIITPDKKELSMNDLGEIAGCKITRALSEANKFSICEFTTTASGIYTIVLQKLDDGGNVLTEMTDYLEFSYSKEYDLTDDKTEQDLIDNLKSISKAGKGIFVENVNDLFINIKTTIDKVFDCRWLLIISAMIIFLADIAVRKFKFKWLHEIIRGKKADGKGIKGGANENR